MKYNKDITLEDTMYINHKYNSMIVPANFELDVFVERLQFDRDETPQEIEGLIEELLEQANIEYKATEFRTLIRYKFNVELLNEHLLNPFGYH